MRDTLLIINGIDSENDLADLGIDVAKKYSRASFVIIISKNGKFRFMRRPNNPEYELEYIDAQDCREKIAQSKK